MLQWRTTTATASEQVLAACSVRRGESILKMPRPGAGVPAGRLRGTAVVLVLWVGLCARAQGHYIQIDQNEFRASGFPRPPLPPPLPPIEYLPHHLPAKELTPAELMVDLTNDLAYRILHYHSILNRNNFALSPTALMSVLIALYEGSSGRSAVELRNVLQLPNNHDIIRVGYRDIHRRLRTYFFGSDNPLKGLSLNKDNVTITRDYEVVLMFYGYDLGMDMVSSTIAPTTTAAPTLPDSTTTSEAPPTSTEALTTDSPATATTSATMPTTPQPVAATTNEADATQATTTAPTTTTEVASTTDPSITATTPTAKTTTAEPKTTTEVATTSEVPPTPATPGDPAARPVDPPTTTTAATETEIETDPDTETKTETETETVADGPTNAMEASELISGLAGDAETFQRIQRKHRVSRLPSGKLLAPPSPTRTPKASYLPASRAGAATKHSRRNRRHLAGLKEVDSDLFVTLFNPQHLPPHQPFPHPAAGPGAAHYSSDYDFETGPHFLSTPDGKQNFNTDVISHVFYLANQQLIHTTFKVYNAVLYYKYFDILKMNVLELELNTPEYNLVIMLPDYHTDLVAAAAALRQGPSLRLIRKQLKPKWVQAIIPDFKLHGTMFLTNDLQNIGIGDIFEPSRADFRSMTEEKNIYVKHIEQSINVNIRTHPINQLKRNYGAQTQPIQISVNHPFLFFVVDRDLDVAVMAGRVLNPLNVRIQ